MQANTASKWTKTVLKQQHTQTRDKDNKSDEAKIARSALTVPSSRPPFLTNLLCTVYKNKIKTVIGKEQLSENFQRRSLSARLMSLAG